MKERKICWLLAFLLLAGCHLGSNTPSSPSNDPPIALRRIDVRINSVEYLRRIEDRAAPKGRKYVILDVTIRNLTCSSLEMSPFYFVLITDKGQRVRCDIISTILLADPLAYFYLPPGESARGHLVFLVDEDSEAQELVYGYWEFLEERFEIGGGEGDEGEKP